MNDVARKKVADAIVVSIGAAKKPEAEEAKSEEGPDVGLVAAMDDFLAAVQAKDSTAMAEAWRNAKDLS